MLKSFKKYMNTRHCNIKFTVEEEQDNKISFLDISIARVGNELKTSLSSAVYLTLAVIYKIRTKKV